MLAVADAPKEVVVTSNVMLSVPTGITRDAAVGAATAGLLLESVTDQVRGCRVAIELHGSDHRLTAGDRIRRQRDGFDRDRPHRQLSRERLGSSDRLDVADRVGEHRRRRDSGTRLCLPAGTTTLAGTTPMEIFARQIDGEPTETSFVVKVDLPRNRTARRRLAGETQRLELFRRRYVARLAGRRAEVRRERHLAVTIE